MKAHRRTIQSLSTAWAALLMVALIGGCSGDLTTGECRDGEIVDHYICENGQWVDYDGPCAGVNCSNRGDCVEVDDEPQCECDEGFEAQDLQCVESANGGDGCAGVDCGDHGVCELDAVGDPRCECDEGYQPSGLSCSATNQESACEGVDCGEGGHCEPDAVGDPRCECDNGYQPVGLSCEEVDPCEEINCGPNGTCSLDGDGDPQCFCGAGYEPSETGLTCVPEGEDDPCEGVNCGPNGVCSTDANDDPICACDAGYQRGPGFSCEPEPEPDPCEGVSCGVGGTCFDNGGSPACSCDAGYEPSGLNCVAVAQCQGVNDTCTAHVLHDGHSNYTVTDYEQTDLEGQLDSPIVAAFALEDTDRGYLLTASSYLRINTNDFSVQATGPLSDIHPDLGSSIPLAGAYNVPQRHANPGVDVGDGDDALTFLRQPASGPHQAFLLTYNFSQASFEEYPDHQGWFDVEWDPEAGDPSDIPSEDQEFLAFWLDDNNHRGFAQGSAAEACDDETAPDDTVDMPYHAVLTAQSLHFALATHCFPFVDRQWNSSAQVFSDFGNAPNYLDVGAAFWQNKKLYFFSTGYYE